MCGDELFFYFLFASTVRVLSIIVHVVLQDYLDFVYSSCRSLSQVGDRECIDSEAVYFGYQNIIQTLLNILI